jgi:hypothetical protein
MNYYDLVLGLIPVVFAGVGALLVTVGVALTASVALASVLSAGLIGHAVFVRAPIGVGTGETAGGDAGFQSAD